MIYVVDDDPAVRDSETAMLSSEGFSVASFASGEALLTAMEDEPPDCILLDIELPGKDGIDVLDDLKLYDAVPVIVVSGKVTPAVRIRATIRGVAAVLQKPIAADRLLGIIRSALDGVRAPEPPPEPL